MAEAKCLTCLLCVHYQQARKIIYLFDKNGDGAIDFGEFCSLLEEGVISWRFRTGVLLLRKTCFFATKASTHNNFIITILQQIAHHPTNMVLRRRFNGLELMELRSEA